MLKAVLLVPHFVLLKYNTETPLIPLCSYKHSYGHSTYPLRILQVSQVILVSDPCLHTFCATKTLSVFFVSATSVARHWGAWVTN